MTNSIYEKNMKLIKKRNPYLYNKINNIEISTVKKIITKDHNNNVIKYINDSYFIIHSQYDPQCQAKFIAKNVFNDKSDIIFLFGLGLGYELKEMIKLNSHVRYFIVEPDEEIFKMLIQNDDMEFLFNKINIHFILGKKSEDIGQFYNTVIGFEKSVNVRFIVLPSYQNIYENLIYDTFSNIKDKINIFKVNINTIIASHRQWVQNYIGNLKYLDSMCPVTKLKKFLKGKPAIIVSAGPSLNYNIDAIRKIQGKVLIATAGSGISILETKKIKADVICMIDGWQEESKLIKNISLNKNTALFYSSMLYYKIVDQLYGSKFLLNVTNMDNTIYNTVGENPFNLFSGPSVANSLVYNLSELGCNPIIFLGQDLCYSSGKNYAEGATYEKDMSKEFKSNKYIKMKNKNREDVYTTSVFLAMRTSMEYCIKMHPNIKYLNGTVNGLTIRGAKDIDFNEYVKKNFKSVYNMNLEHIYSYFINIQDNKNKFADMIDNLENENTEIVNLCKNAIKFMESDNDKDKKYKYIKKVNDKLDKISLYKDIISPDLFNLDYIYKNKDYIEKVRQELAYILDKCLIMDNAFTHIVREGK